MRKSGYLVTPAASRKEIEAALMHGRFDLMILGHSLSRNDRHHLPYMAKKSYAAPRVLVLHASGHHHAVDKALDSRQGEEAVLDAIAELLALSAVGV